MTWGGEGHRTAGVGWVGRETQKCHKGCSLLQRGRGVEAWDTKRGGGGLTEVSSRLFITGVGGHGNVIRVVQNLGGGRGHKRVIRVFKLREGGSTEVLSRLFVTAGCVWKHSSVFITVGRGGKLSSSRYGGGQVKTLRRFAHARLGQMAPVMKGVV